MTNLGYLGLKVLKSSSFSSLAIVSIGEIPIAGLDIPVVDYPHDGTADMFRA
jgi:hypothetical protein